MLTFECKPALKCQEIPKAEVALVTLSQSHGIYTAWSIPFSLVNHSVTFCYQKIHRMCFVTEITSPGHTFTFEMYSLLSGWSCKLTITLIFFFPLHPHIMNAFIVLGVLSYKNPPLLHPPHTHIRDYITAKNVSKTDIQSQHCCIRNNIYNECPL